MIVDVTIYLYGDRLQPKQISQLLEIETSGGQAKGQPRHTSPRHLAKIGVWTLSSGVESNSLVDHVEELLKKLGAVPTPLDKIESVEAACLDVFVTADDISTTGVYLDFSKNQLEALSRLGLSLRITVM